MKTLGEVKRTIDEGLNEDFKPDERRSDNIFRFRSKAELERARESEKAKSDAIGRAIDDVRGKFNHDIASARVSDELESDVAGDFNTQTNVIRLADHIVPQSLTETTDQGLADAKEEELMENRSSDFQELVITSRHEATHLQNKLLNPEVSIKRLWFIEGATQLAVERDHGKTTIYDDYKNEVRKMAAITGIDLDRLLDMYEKIPNANSEINLMIDAYEAGMSYDAYRSLVSPANNDMPLTQAA